MATRAHCAFCFETLAASFARRAPLSLAQVDALWAEYEARTTGTGSVNGQDEDDDEDEDMTDSTSTATAKPAAISRLLDEAASSSSGPSLSSGGSALSSGTATPASSLSSGSGGSKNSLSPKEKFPLFVTWNTHSKRSGEKVLRGCIGTFEALPLEQGLRTYALTSAFEDTRFSPIPASLLPSLSAHVTLLHSFSSPVSDPLAWTLGLHGIRISFTHSGRRLGATYLPDVPPEQGWTKEETLVSLMQKAGWRGSRKDWERTWQEGRGELVTYEGKKVDLEYEEWRAWREWVDGRRS